LLLAQTIKMKYIKIKIIFLTLTIFVSFSITPENIHAQSCGEAEWNRIKQQYNLDALLLKMRELINPSSFNQTLYDAYKNHYEQSLIAAERECAAIGADKADQLRITVDNSQSTQSEVQRLQERLWQLEDEERKLLWAEYERASQNLQNSCPSNSTRIGDECWCNAGYTNNSTLTGCIKVEPIPSSFTLQQNKQAPIPTTQPTKNVESTNSPEATETSRLRQDNSSGIETEEIAEEQPQQGFIARVLSFVKNIFSKIFKL